MLKYETKFLQPKQMKQAINEKRYLYTLSKNDIISSVRKHYCALVLKIGLWLGLAKERFRSNYYEKLSYVADLWK